MADPNDNAKRDRSSREEKVPSIKKSKKSLAPTKPTFPCASDEGTKPKEKGEALGESEREENKPQEEWFGTLWGYLLEVKKNHSNFSVEEKRKEVGKVLNRREVSADWYEEFSKHIEDHISWLFDDNLLSRKFDKNAYQGWKEMFQLPLEKANFKVEPAAVALMKICIGTGNPDHRVLEFVDQFVKCAQQEQMQEVQICGSLLFSMISDKNNCYMTKAIETLKKDVRSAIYCLIDSYVLAETFLDPEPNYLFDDLQTSNSFVVSASKIGCSNDLGKSVYAGSASRRRKIKISEICHATHIEDALEIENDANGGPGFRGSKSRHYGIPMVWFGCNTWEEVPEGKKWTIEETLEDFPGLPDKDKDLKRSRYGPFGYRIDLDEALEVYAASMGPGNSVDNLKFFDLGTRVFRERF